LAQTARIIPYERFRARFSRFPLPAPDIRVIDFIINRSSTAVRIEATHPGELRRAQNRRIGEETLDFFHS
jgi:hypothetical protein